MVRYLLRISRERKEVCVIFVLMFDVLMFDVWMFGCLMFDVANFWAWVRYPDRGWGKCKKALLWDMLGNLILTIETNHDDLK